MEQIKINTAVAYYRVSSDKQVSQGNGLDTQQWACESWAQRNNCTIEKFYIDAAKTGTKTEGRDQLAEMIDYLSKIKEPRLVLFYDISRLARNAGDFIKLRKSMERCGHRFAGMREAARNGYWITQPPKGYQFVKIGARKELKRHEPLAGIIQEALEQFASAKLVSQTDVANFLTERMHLAGVPTPKNIFDFVKRILTDRKYTGIFAYPKYDIPVQKWHIEPLIDTQTFELIQDRLRGRNRLRHKTYNKHDERFPLKGFITCPECGRPLTASMTKGGKYPYYQCQNRKCPAKKQANVSPQVLHHEFETEILNKITPKENLIALTRALATKEYAARHQLASADNEEKKKRIAAIEQEQSRITDAYISANDVMKRALNAKIDALETEKLALQSNVDNFTPELMPFDEAFGYIADFLHCPTEAWRKGDYRIKQTVLNLCFSGRLSYNKEQKFGTVHLSPIFGLFNSFSGENSLVVP